LGRTFPFGEFKKKKKKKEMPQGKKTCKEDKVIDKKRKVSGGIGQIIHAQGTLEAEKTERRGKRVQKES